MNDKVQEGEKHFTASVWILSKSNPKKMLLVFHKKFQLWIQPGGHIELFENPVDAAIREVHEETGLDISFLSKQVKPSNEVSFLPIPKIFMEQTIPPHGGQPQHFHEDLSYVVEIDEQEARSEHEDGKIGWFTKEEILKMPVHEDTRVVVEKLM